MIYTLTLCLGMYWGLCGQRPTYDFPTLAECEAAKAGIPPEIHWQWLCHLRTEDQAPGGQEP